MKNLNYLNQYRKKYIGTMGDYNNGRFLIPSKDGKKMFHIIASNGFGWEHVSISLRSMEYPEEVMIERCPFWEEMLEVKDLFFYENETALQIFPKEENYVNNHPYVLHLWRKSNQNICKPSLQNPQIIQSEIQGSKTIYNVTIYNDVNWTQASIKVRSNKGIILDRFPKWSEMSEAKKKIFLPQHATFQFMDNNINDDFALSWWYSHDEHIPLPHSLLVGFKGLNL